MIVVADTSPLNYLALIGQVALLHKLFGAVVVPKAVAGELTAAGAPPAARHLIESPPAWLSVVQAAQIDATLPPLGAGETEAISLALELKADLLLCDDADARKAATQRGVRVAGTLGVLEAGAMRGHIDLPACVAQLRTTTMRMPEDLVARLLRDDAARRPAQGQ